MRTYAWMGVVLLAGCVAPAPPEPESQLPAQVYRAPECPTFPDGSAFDCTKSTWDPALAAPPSYVEGWKCHSAWSDTGMSGELWSNRDGRAGFAWNWTRWKEDGLAWQRLAIHENATRGGLLNTAYRPTGFAGLARPLQPSGAVVAYVHLHLYRAWILEDAVWRIAPEVEFFVNGFGPQMWITARITLPNATYHVDLMQRRQGGDDNPYEWSLRPFEETLDGTRILFQHQNRGSKNTNIDYDAMVRNPFNCGRVPSASTLV